MAHFIASAKTEVKLKLVTKIFGQDYDIASRHKQLKAIGHLWKLVIYQRKSKITQHFLQDIFLAIHHYISFLSIRQISKSVGDNKQFHGGF